MDLAKEIAESKPELVIDLGCGGNVFKKHIPNLIGIDLVDHPDVDIVDDLHNAESHVKGKADWILNFGPLQYTDPEEQVSMMARMLKPGGTIVCHAREDNLSFREVHELGHKFGLYISRVNDSWTDTIQMTPEDWEIQKNVIEEHGLKFDGRYLAPRLTWRWRHVWNGKT